MATLYITEFANAAMGGLIGPTSSAPLAAPLTPPVAEQSVGIGGSSNASLAFNAFTTFVMVNCDTACSLAWGPVSEPPVAVTTAQRMGPNETRFYGVPKGQNYAVAVIANS